MEINLLKYNQHWEKGFYYPYPKTRAIFSALRSSLTNKQIVEVTGLRRVGKSTLLFQLINHLIKNKVNPYNIMYFTFDETQPSIEFLLENYHQQTNINYKKENIFVFLDEIQKLNNFQNQIKVYYDLYPHIKFFISGSTSLFIRRKNQESLAGRVFSLFLKPLTFPEYLMFREKSELLEKPILYHNELEKEFVIFLQSQFIESIPLKIYEKKEYFSSIVKKIIYEDLPSIFQFDNPHLLFRLCQYIAQKPGCLINNVRIAQEFGISNKTIALYLSYLEEAFLIKKLYNFSTNIISSEKRLKKYYLSSPSFSSALVDFSDRGALFENYLSSVSDYMYFYRDVYGNEVDFVTIEKNKIIIPIEVKYKKELNASDVKNAFLFLKKFNQKKGNLVYIGNKTYIVKKEKSTITIQPVWKFSL